MIESVVCSSSFKLCSVLDVRVDVSYTHIEKYCCDFSLNPIACYFTSGNGVTNPSWENGTEEWVHIQKGTQNGAMKPVRQPFCISYITLWNTEY